MTRDEVKHERQTFLRQRLTRVIVGWVTIHTWKNNELRVTSHIIVDDAHRKRNFTLNRSLGTLQLSRAPLIVNVVSVAVL